MNLKADSSARQNPTRDRVGHRTAKMHAVNWRGGRHAAAEASPAGCSRPTQPEDFWQLINSPVQGAICCGTQQRCRRSTSSRAAHLPHHASRIRHSANASQRWGLRMRLWAAGCTVCGEGGLRGWNLRRFADRRAAYGGPKRRSGIIASGGRLSPAGRRERVRTLATASGCC